MSKKINELRHSLLKTLDDLGYVDTEIIQFELLADIIPRYITYKLKGQILDFIILPHRECHPKGLTYNNLLSPSAFNVTA